jgi:hypothetical protein
MCGYIPSEGKETIAVADNEVQSAALLKNFRVQKKRQFIDQFRRY